jgi:hypothetical protein
MTNFTREKTSAVLQYLVEQIVSCKIRIHDFRSLSCAKHFYFPHMKYGNGHTPHKILSDLKWRLKFNMTANFQWDVTFVLINNLLHFFCVENAKKMWKKFFSLASLAQAVGQKWFFGHNFESIQLFFVLFLR